ncbi:transposase [Aristaeella lactis]|uniref:REP element-mobilizing transposase RayT n=1 Tax=Aristaeella lactis TaxID=3046383 RepID=A0AC61PNI1_9FIRM|nr:transposase [Aristaeella lactis]QUA52549.1 transposase [Aristaeella lactis]SMC77090.1 REP element-mobilizing transposase RayT [Aristaeella lactis]
MPRTARKKSCKQIYHVMLRGINKQQIFYEKEDYQFFVSLLERYKEPCGYEIYAYCLMGNHIHLLIREGNEVTTGDIFRHIGSAFVYWYNIKYERVGHLFQDRYKSEPVEDETYLLTVFRYILNNPVKAGLCCKAEEYPYSSAGEYLKGINGITDTSYIKGMYNEKNLKEYIYQKNEDQCMEMDETNRKRVTDEEARQLISKELGGVIPAIGKAKERKGLNSSINRLIRAGISIRQLSRLTGITKKIIENALE